MKPAQRKLLYQKIDESLNEVVAKHNERREKLRENWLTWYSPAQAPPEYRDALQSKRNKGV